MKTQIEVIKDDITKLNVDVIVNAANESLLGGGGVDGAIHRAAGPELLKECKTLHGCPTGEAKLTKGYLLPAHFIIHTVGPVWHDGNTNEEALLASCYQKSLSIAEQNHFGSIAFPNISTGVYHFPKEKAATIAIKEVNKFISSGTVIQKIIFVCFDDENYEIYQRKLNEVQ